jgi:hypothetical protein
MPSGAKKRKAAKKKREQEANNNNNSSISTNNPQGSFFFQNCPRGFRFFTTITHHLPICHSIMHSLTEPARYVIWIRVMGFCWQVLFWLRLIGLVHFSMQFVMGTYQWPFGFDWVCCRSFGVFVDSGLTSL